MKVLLINGSPKEHENTFLALSEVARTLNAEGIETEIVSIGKQAARCCCHAADIPQAAIACVTSRPELLLARFLHPSLTFRTGFHVPDTYFVTAALQAQSAHLAPVGRCDIGDDATHDDVLNRLTVRTRHRRNLLTEQAATLIYLGLVAAVLAAILQFPSHALIRLSPQYKS